MASCVLCLFAVHDASAKLPPGLLNGNVNQYGDIDQCLQVRSPWQGGVIKGRYCLTTMALRLSDPHHPLLKHVQQLLQSHDMVHSELDDVSTVTGCPVLCPDPSGKCTHIQRGSITVSPHRTVRCGPVGVTGAHYEPRPPRADMSPKDVHRSV